MDEGAILTGGVVLGVAAAGLALRRRQVRSILEDWCPRHGWADASHRRRELLARLGALSLMRTGYNRDLPTLFEDGQGIVLFEYRFETGFEHQRQSHRYLGVMTPVAHSRGRATFTADMWMKVANDLPWRRVVDLPGASSNSAAGRRVGLVEEPTAWTDGSARAWLQRIAQEPAERTWETLADCLVGFESATSVATQVESLVASGKELTKLL